VVSPSYAELTQPQPLNLKETQQLLDSDTLLLEYSLGDEHSYLWAVSPTSVSSFELPGRKEIDEAARHFFELAKTEAQSEQAMEAGNSLSRILLSPVISLLGTKRLVIVSDGALQYVPFAALPAPDSRVSASSHLRVDFVPLIADHEIVSLPSASTLTVLRRETNGRKPVAKAVAVLADPVFGKDDPRVATASNGARRSSQRSGIEETKGVSEGKSSTTEDAFAKSDLVRSA